MEGKKSKSLFTLFWGIFTVSAFTFGGGFVIVTFLKRKFVDELHWIDEREMLDFIALAQSTPGSIVVNASILLGWSVRGFPGMAVAVAGAVLPPMLVLTLISFCYAAFAENRVVSLMLRGMQAGVAAVILDAAVNMGKGVLKEKNLLHMLMMGIAFILSLFLGVNVIWLILGALILGAAETLALRKKGREPNKS